MRAAVFGALLAALAQAPAAPAAPQAAGARAAAPLSAPLPRQRLALKKAVFRAESGPVCGDAGIIGRELPEIVAPGWCGIPRPVLVTRIDAVAIERPIKVNCRTARALATWTRRGPAKLAPELLDARLVAIRPSGAYACRPRNNVMGGRLSEHAAGNAVDIPAFRLSDGRVLRVKRDWGAGAEGRFLRAVWRAACGPFGTVLGPDYNAQHADHLHLDTASRISAPVCE